MDPFYLLLFAIFFALVLLFFFLKNQTTPTVVTAPERSPEDIKLNYVSKDLYTAIVAQVEMAKEELQEKENEVRALSAQLAARDQQVAYMEQALRDGKQETEGLQKQLKVEFENIANRLLEEKGRNLSEQSHQQLQSVLLPLREKIKDFETNIERKFLEETREKSSLKKEIETLHSLNQQLSTDANNLASALKGSNKIQGTWGEYQLEILLEKAGLVKGLHFQAQNSYRDDYGRLKRPDFIIQLPDDRQLILDAKVSLTAFERYFHAEDAESKQKYLKQHIESLRKHIQNLSSKEYQLLSDIHAPDYTMLFVPIESALSIAAQSEPKLFTEALEQNVVLVSTGSLLTTMRTVSHIWKQEKQARSVIEISRQSGLLYDKFVSFIEDLKTIGLRLESAKSAYDGALNKLVNSPRQGDTLIGRAERIRALGARTSKRLPKDLVEEAQEQPTIKL